MIPGASGAFAEGVIRLTDEARRRIADVVPVQAAVASYPGGTDRA